MSSFKKLSSFLRKLQFALSAIAIAFAHNVFIISLSSAVTRGYDKDVEGLGHLIDLCVYALTISATMAVGLAAATKESWWITLVYTFLMMAISGYFTICLDYLLIGTVGWTYAMVGVMYTLVLFKKHLQAGKEENILLFQSTLESETTRVEIRN